MKKIVLLLAFSVIFCRAGENINISFKKDLKNLPASARSDTVTFKGGSSLKLDGKNVRKVHTAVGQYFYLFGDNARRLIGKKLQLKAVMRRDSGDSPVGAGWRVYAKGNKYVGGRSQNFALKERGKWQEITVDFEVPPLPDINNVNVGFSIRQEGKENNLIYIDDIRIVSARGSGLIHNPSCSLGAAQLQLNKKPLVLVKDGKPLFKIVTAEKASSTAAYAAKEIQEHLQLMTGVKVPIIHDQNYAAPAIWIGATAMSRKYGVDPAMLPLENTVVARAGNAIILSGGDGPDKGGNYFLSRTTLALGTLDAAYEFLEKIFNCRWYWPGKNGTVAPPCRDLSVDRLFLTGAPAYDCRALFFDIIQPKEVPTVEVLKWQRRNRLGGSLRDPIGMHAFQGWPAKYGKEHPEYFALQLDGKRKINEVSGIHLCMTNPEVIQKAAEYAIEAFKKNPNLKCFSIMPGDSNNLYYCRCPKCQAEVTPKKGSFGIHSNAVWSFVNNVAAIVGKKYPDKYIKCCAYGDYLRKPDMALRPNVIVTLCFGTSTRANLDAYKIPWRKVIDEWSTTGARLYVWEYWNGPRSGRGIYGAPTIFPRQLREIYLLDRTMVSGRVLELANTLSTGVSLPYWADWHYDVLNLYFSMKLMWNPDMDVESELERYYTTFYGPAAATMREFYDEMENAWLNSVWHQNSTFVWDWEVCWQKTYPPAFVDRMMGLLRKAVRETEGKEPFSFRTKKTLQGFLPFERNSMIFRGVKPEGARNLSVPRSNAAVKIDGILGADEWARAVKIGDFRDSYGVYKVSSATEMFFQHDGKNLYVAINATSRKKPDQIHWLPATQGKRDSLLWNYESVELFFCGKGNDYYQFIIAPDDAVLDIAGAKYSKVPLSEMMKWTSHILFATKRNGSGWTAEAAIPLSDLKFKEPVGSGAFRVDFARNHWYYNEHKKAFWEQTMWIPTYGAFLTPDRFGIMELK